MTTAALQDDVKKVAIGAGVSLLGGVTGKGLFFLSQIIIARILGVEGFGLYALGFAIVKISDIIARLGINVGGMRFISLYNTDSPQNLKGTVITALIITLVNAVIIAVILYVFSERIAYLIFHNPEMVNALKLFSYSIPFVTTMTVLSSLLQGFHTMKYTVYTRDTIQPIANIMFIIIFYFMNLKLSGIIYAFIFSHFISILFACYYLNYMFPPIKEPTVRPVYEIRQLISYSFPLLFVGVLHYLIAWTDTLMLGYLSSGKDVGIYRAAFQIPYVMTVFLMAANSIYAPLAADLYQKGEMERLSFILKGITRWVTFVTVPIFIFLQFSAKEVMAIFGNEYIETGYIVLIILSLGQLINCITGSVGYTLTMTGNQKIELINSILLGLVSIILNFWLIPKYGALGAAIASCSSMCLINMIRVLEIYWIFKINSLSKETYMVIFPMILSIIIMTFAHGLFSGNMKLAINILVIIGNFVFYFKMSLSNADEFIKDTIRSKLFGRTVV